MSIAAARPRVTVQKLADDKESKAEHVRMPYVFLSPIRSDIVQFVHTNMAKNSRQPYAVSPGAGHQHSAESWGTGRAVSRIPRVSGGGTARAGQGAFANMCRKGRMFAPTRIWRKWHRKINQNQKRYAVCSALAATALPSLVAARGHKIDQVPEVPLVVSDSIEGLTKTRKALEALRALGAGDDVDKARESKKIRAGKGKMRNRRHTLRRGPLIVFNEDKGLVKAVRNLPGVEVAHVDRLNLLQLAPGGHMGRFCIWTQSAFKRLDTVWGTFRQTSSEKLGYHLPHNIVSNSDITRIINSDEVQSKVRAPITRVKRVGVKKNPLKNLGVMVRLNPHALRARRNELKRQRRAKILRSGTPKAVKKIKELRKLKKASDSKHRKVQAANTARITKAE